MIPIVDSMKTVGLVQLRDDDGPHYWRASPIEAVKYQVLVMFMLTAAVALTSMVVGFFAYRKFFTKEHQLII